MTFIQPTLALFVLVLLMVYFGRFRTKLRDRMLILVFVAVALTAIAKPELANVLAHQFGVGRGVDLLLYLSAPGLGFLLLLMFAQIRELKEQLTILTREQALSGATRISPIQDTIQSVNPRGSPAVSQERRAT